MGRASGGSNTLHWIRNSILDFLRAMSVGLYIGSGSYSWRRTLIFIEQKDRIPRIKGFNSYD